MKKIAFNQDWTFIKEGSLGRLICLPHDATQEEGRRADAPSGKGGAFYLGGFYKYKKKFSVPPEWENQDIMLEFEGIYPSADIYLNGTKIGSCTYGYAGYRFHLNNLIYGQDNILTVEVDNRQVPNSRWYAGAGIYRPVWLWQGGKEHILPDGIRVTTLNTAPAQIEVEISDNVQQTDDVTPLIEISRGGETVAQSRGRRAIIDIPDAYLWDAEHPHLYECKVSLTKAGQIIDYQSTNFGIRKLAWSPQGLFVNGKMVLLKGGCIHHDNGILGARNFAESEWRRIRRLKANGFNAIRSAHNPIAVSVLEACDTLGMYVMDEGWDQWYKHKTEHDYAGHFEAGFREDLTAMVTKDYNHPSVIMYSIGNEISEPAEEKGLLLGKEMINLLHKHDPSRPVTAGINLTLLYSSTIDRKSIPREMDEEGKAMMRVMENKEMNSTVYNEMVALMGTKFNQTAATAEADRVTSPILDALDIAGYNYADSRYGMEGQKHPDRIICGTETFVHALASNWRQVEAYPYLIGDFMWSAWDYLGEVGTGVWSWEPDAPMFNKGYPWLLAETGVFDILGNENAEAGMAAVIWGSRTVPYIGVVPVNHPGQTVAKAIWRGSNALPYWSYQGCTGNSAEVEVYSKGHSAELFINGRSLGKQELRECKTVFMTMYEPGIIKAVAYDANNNYISESSLQSADENTVIKICPEERLIKNSRILYVDINLTGSNGEIECNRDTMLAVQVTGGELLGFGSANPRTEESFQEGKYTTYYGRSLAVIRCQSNQLQITVCGDGLETVSLTVETSVQDKGIGAEHVSKSENQE